MRWTSLFVVLMACGDDGATVTPDAKLADAPTADATNLMPQTLAETGLCLDAGCSQISPDVYAYKPQYELWSDGATKRRWIYLPPNTTINSSNMNFWEFPVGTKVWKEFTRDNIRVETRLIMRVAANGTKSDWFYMPYVWNAAQDATTGEPMGVPNANGTEHDVPSRFQCQGCHENLQPSRVLGFSAIELDWNNPDDAQLDLQKLVDLGKLSAPPTGSTPYFPIPGTANEKEVLGYMHANCGHCHNASSNVQGNTPMQLRLDVGMLGTVADTPTYTTAVDITGNMIGGFSKIVAKGEPDQSIMIYRFESTNPTEHMPALGSEVIDDSARMALRTWITNLQ
jgi:hypothetical protein